MQRILTAMERVARGECLGRRKQSFRKQRRSRRSCETWEFHLDACLIAVVLIVAVCKMLAGRCQLKISGEW